MPDSGHVGQMDGGHYDAGHADAGGGHDSGASDGGPDAVVPGTAGACEACTGDADCLPDHYCAPLMSGGQACLPRCNPDLPDCPPRFDCVANFTSSIPDPVCAPVGERCCVDADGDLHGTGVGCLGLDCNDDDPATNDSANELCDNIDNDCDGTVDNGDPNVLCPRGTHVAMTSCGGGMCEVAGCEPGFADCNGDPLDGCEVSTGSSTDCGACGAPCMPPHSVGDCSSGACRVGTCEAGWGDCNGMAADGCETPLNTLTDCGACGVGCSLPHASASCATGTCQVAGCDSGWGDCGPVAGCETSTRTNADCGGCGVICAPSHGVGDCSTGSCALAGCNSGWGDCNFDAVDCETSLRTTTNCGGCGTPCSLPGASTSCSTGSCNFSSCNSDYSNCDGTTSNGCEVSHASVFGSCGSNDVGTYDGDTACGFICGGNTGWDEFATRTGTSSAWFKARNNEDSNCSATIEHRIRLEVPAGIDYDLYVYRGSSCGARTLVGSSRAGAGTADEVIVSQADNSGPEDDFDYWVEVRYYSGASCTPWTLRFYGHDC